MTGGREGGEKQKLGTRKNTGSQELQAEEGEMEWGKRSNSVSGLDLRLDN